jgi:hypothetical protein
MTPTTTCYICHNCGNHFLGWECPKCGHHPDEYCNCGFDSTTTWFPTTTWIPTTTTSYEPTPTTTLYNTLVLNINNKKYYLKDGYNFSLKLATGKNVNISFDNVENMPTPQTIEVRSKNEKIVTTSLSIFYRYINIIAQSAGSTRITIRANYETHSVDSYIIINVYDNISTTTWFPTTTTSWRPTTTTTWFPTTTTSWRPTTTTTWFPTTTTSWRPTTTTTKW